jgi:hypothetical protein
LTAISLHAGLDSEIDAFARKAMERVGRRLVDWIDQGEAMPIKFVFDGDRAIRMTAMKMLLERGCRSSRPARV